MLDDVKDILRKIFKHYKYSPKAVREVRQLATAMQEHFQKPNRVDGTRWTPHMRRALEILADSYSVLLTHFEHVSQAAPGETTADVKGRATFLVKKLRDMKIIKFVHFMQDLLEIIAQLSLAFQSDHCTVNSMMDSFETANLQLTALTLAPGAHLAAFNAELQEDPADPNTFIYKGVTLRNMQNEDNIYNDVILDVQNRINNYLESQRDPATDILRAARIFDVAEWPHGREDLSIYGDQEMTKLLEHYDPLLNRLKIEPRQVKQEWIALKAYISNANWLTLATCFTNGQESRFHNILKLYEIVLALPVSSAVCERAFSCLKRIKSDWRCQLATEQLDHLMMVSIEGPTLEEYDAEKAIHRWWTCGQRARRPSFQPQPSAGKAATNDSDILDYLLDQ